MSSREDTGTNQKGYGRVIQSEQPGISDFGIGGTMDLVVMGVVAGVLGTLVMDFLNHLFARTGMLLKIDMRIIRKMSMPPKTPVRSR